MYKQVILIRQDLELPKGKLGVQSAHAAVECVLKSDDKMIKAWRNEGMKKVLIKVANEKELYKYMQMAKDSRLITCIITDAGKTVVESGTVTCGAIGPDKEDKIDEITGKLRLL